MHKKWCSDRNQLDRRTFECLHRKLSKSESFHSSTHDTAMEVRDYPSTSSKAVGRALNLRYAIVLRTFYEDGMHPYHLQRV